MIKNFKENDDILDYNFIKFVDCLLYTEYIEYYINEEPEALDLSIFYYLLAYVETKKEELFPLIKGNIYELMTFFRQKYKDKNEVCDSINDVIRLINNDKTSLKSEKNFLVKQIKSRRIDTLFKEPTMITFDQLRHIIYTSIAFDFQVLQYLTIDNEEYINLAKEHYKNEEYEIFLVSVNKILSEKPQVFDKSNIQRIFDVLDNKQELDDTYDTYKISNKIIKTLKR